VVNPFLQAGNADPKDSSTFDVDAAKKVFDFFNATALEVGLWSAVEACISTSKTYQKYVDSDNAKHSGTGTFRMAPRILESVCAAMLVGGFLLASVFAPNCHYGRRIALAAPYYSGCFRNKKSCD
jgi:hypothetical protein